MSRPILTLALSLMLALPAAAAPLSEDLTSRLEAAREAYRSSLTVPLTAPTRPASPALAAYDRALAEVQAQAAKPDPRDPYLKRKGMWVRPYATDVTRLHMLEVFDKAQAMGVNEIYLETFFHGKVLYHRPGETAFPRTHAQVDVAAAYAAEARRRGMKLYAWVHTLKWGADYAKAHPDHLVQDGWGKPATSTEGASAFIVSPSVEAVRRQLYTLAEEIAETGHYDGLILDYIRYPVRIKGDDVDATPDPRNFWGYTPEALARFFEENPDWDTPAFRRFLEENELPDPALREPWLRVWKTWLAGEIEELIAGIRQRTKGRLELSMAFFPNYYFHRHDNRMQESARWMEHFDWVSPMCYSYFLDWFPDPFGHYNIDRELRIVEAALQAYLPSERPTVVPSLTEDAPGTKLEAKYHHRPFPTQLAWLKGRKLEGSYPQTRGVAYFTYGWMFPEAEKARKAPN
ncbi:MAG: hypothetical protein ACLGIN_05615 [Candidatus Sericytochromatia bacterium]